MRSANFEFLEVYHEQLVQLGYFAERFFAEDPNTSLIKSRQFAELITKETAARTANYALGDREAFSELLRRLRTDRVIPQEVLEIIHAIRKQGNTAVHEFTGSHSEALSNLKLARALAIWFHRTFGGDPRFKPGPFVPPQSPKNDEKSVQVELQRLRDAVINAEAEARQHAENSEEHKKALQAVSEIAKQATEESRIWQELAAEQERQQSVLNKQLRKLQEEAEAAPVQTTLSFVTAAHNAGDAIELDEGATRALVDVKLSEAGWEVDSRLIRHAAGSRPAPGKNRAIAEWPTSSGPVDYALFVGLRCVAVVEAKRIARDVPAVLEQAKRYAQDVILDRECVDPESPWQHGLEKPFQVPFALATNGRPYIRQFANKSGIWFWDGRRETNHPIALPQWFSPQDLASKLEQNHQPTAYELAEDTIGFAALRRYQQAAISAVEEAIQNGQQQILIAMATGTGKTRTCIGLMYRLLKQKRFRRILFLVDRTALGEQTTDALNTTEIEGFLNFSQIYKVAGLQKRLPDKEDQVHVATVQSLVARILNEDDPEKRPTPGMYDCIIVDEAHRGYTLDAELIETASSFRNIADYLSKYRQVLEYFDAFKIGLTATPAIHTTEIFGRPVFSYSYRRAVIDGWLVDHLPPKRITTALSEAGIRFEGGEEVEIIDPKSGQIDLFALPDMVEFEVEQFNKRVYSESFNRVVCEALASEIDIDHPGKTLIFAARDDHADTVVRLLKQALQAEHGAIPNDMVMKITGSVDNTQDKILRFRNDALPKYVVTVDLLTTGVDIPKICNLVFLRRVNSRILYDQMIGRATRLCRDIGKEHFRIFDAVDLYAHLQELSDMRPIVTQPKVPLSELIEDLRSASSPDDQRWIADQIIVIVRAKARHLDKGQAALVQSVAKLPATGLADKLNNMTPEEMKAWFAAHPSVSQVLDARPASSGRPGGIMISEHRDELISVDDYFGNNATPEDYIDGFERFIRQNMNTVPAIVAVTQKPRDLTRKELRDLATLLDDNGYSETSLRTAYGRARNSDIAAHIIGYVRQAALGDPLVPYETRVENALRRIEGSRPWNASQKRWLKRIGRALKETPVADVDTLNEGAFAGQGGFVQIQREFGEELESALRQINEAIWSTPAA
ncbi:type I restriction-modification system endonuclease [Mesorhizobium sp. M0522]|uniref:type I restriction-modification system endonuclease n=1 Tax=Mesorhizobium sp. M0522 TaxID=2956958 RepID=UPI0033394342